MAFDTDLLVGGLTDSHDLSRMNYRRVLAIHANVLATTDAPHQTAFTTAFDALFGDSSADAFRSYGAEAQERMVEWARLDLLRQRADFAPVALPAHVDEPFFIDFHEAQWLTLDRRVVDTVIFATERWAVENLDVLAAATIRDRLEANGMPRNATEFFQQWNRMNAKAAVALLHLMDTAYLDITDADENELNLGTIAAPVREVATRAKDLNWLAHLIVRGWYADARKTLALADARQSFNAITQTDWGDEAMDALRVEMEELFQRLGGSSEISNLNHRLIIGHAEMLAHGFIPSTSLQLFETTPDNGLLITQPGAIWLEPVDGEQIINATGPSFRLKIFVPEGVSVDAFSVRWNHPQGNALFTRYINLAAAAAVDADNFAVANADDAGVGLNRVTGDKAAKWTGGAGGTVFIIGTFTFNYIAAGVTPFDISPNPYAMTPQLESITDGATDVSSNFEMKGHRIMSGLVQDGSTPVSFPPQGTIAKTVTS